MSYLYDITLDDSNLPPPTAAIDKERKVAIHDLLERNRFEFPQQDAAEGTDAPNGPYALTLSLRSKKLAFLLSDKKSNTIKEFYLSLGPFRQVVKDYFQICESYFDAIKTLPANQIETIDMARRGIHNEGARVLQERLEGKVLIDTDTARRLFTLICVLHLGEEQT